MWKVSVMTASAPAKAASASPMPWVKASATLVPQSSWISGAPGPVAAVRHHHRDDFPDVARPVAAERELGRLAELELDARAQSWRHRAEERERLHPALEVVEGEHADDARHGRGRAGADGGDTRVAVRRPEEGGMEHARQDHV